MALALLVSLLALLLGACGPASSPDSSPLPPGPTPTITVPVQMPVVVSMAGAFDDQMLALLDRQVAAFEEQYPGIRVELVGANRDADRRRADWGNRLAGGDTSRDIYVLNPTWVDFYASRGWLRPLDAYAAALGLDVARFLPAAVQANTIDGQLLALPWTVDGGVLYYRRDLLAEQGETLSAGWAEVQDAALAARAGAGLPYGFVWQGAPDDVLTCNTLEFVWAYGGQVLDEAGRPVFDSPETRAALAHMLALIASGASPPDVAAFREAASLAAFQRGEAALMRNWAYAAGRLPAGDWPASWELGIAALPASCLGGQSLGLSAHSLHPREAFLFMAFLDQAEQQAQLAASGVQPPALSTVYALEPGAGDLLHQFYAALSASRPRPRTPFYPEVSLVIYTGVNVMLRGEQDPAAAAAAIQARLEAVLP